MSDSTSITYQDVAAAFEGILIDHANPTIRNIREKLGRGSHTTIREFSAQYHKSNSISTLLGQSHLSSTFIGAAVAEIKRVVDQRSKQLEAQVQALREDNAELAALTSEQESTIQGLNNQVSDLESKLASAFQNGALEKEKLQLKLDHAFEQKTNLETELARVTQALLGAEQRAAGDQERAHRNRDLETRLDNAEKRNRTLEEDVRALNSQLHEAQQALLDAEKRANAQKSHQNNRGAKNS